MEPPWSSVVATGGDGVGVAVVVVVVVLGVVVVRRRRVVTVRVTVRVTVARGASWSPAVSGSLARPTGWLVRSLALSETRAATARPRRAISTQRMARP